MAASHPNAALDNRTVLFAAGAVGTLTDAELLARFAAGRGDAASQAAFAALVDRHGPMVLGVCRRATGDVHAADDAFQAVFLILARKARSVRPGEDDSIGPWMFGVARRVAQRARGSARGRLATTGLDGLDPAAPASEQDSVERSDLRAAIDGEIARLPARYRSAVVLCHLEGLSQEQAARRLRCPVGTVQSRLHRARERLRAGLMRRGLAPAAGSLAVLLEGSSRAAATAPLMQKTVASAARIATGSPIAQAAPAAVAVLAVSTTRSLLMRKSWTAAGLLALGLATTTGAVALATGGQEPRTEAPKAEAKAAPEAAAGPSLGDRLDRIQDEYLLARRAHGAFFQGSTIPEEDRAKAAAVAPDYPAVVRRIAEIASTAPKDPAVRDAMIWIVLNGLAGGDGGIYAAESALAGTWLARNFGDDPDAVRVGLSLDPAPNAFRDNLVLMFYASAKGREAKGLARLALAQYLERKAGMAERAKAVEGRPTYVHDDLVRADGTLYTETEVQPDSDYAYLLHLKQCDPAYLLAESERLYEEVIAEYADVPFVTARIRLLEALLKKPAPRQNGEPVDEEARQRIEAVLARPRSTLGEAAEARLDDRRNLAVGKLAPEIRGLDLDGKPTALSDYRGKVVALVFWGTWCGPCMREIPREQALVEKMKGRPFAMLGVNVDGDPEAAREAVRSRGVAWPSWRDGEPGEGPIARLYHVRSYPTVYLLDGEGKIRSKNTHGEAMGRLVEQLVAETEAAGR